jgi:hypothetical protein
MSVSFWEDYAVLKDYQDVDLPIIPRSGETVRLDISGIGNVDYEVTSVIHNINKDGVSQIKIEISKV